MHTHAHPTGIPTSAAIGEKREERQTMAAAAEEDIPLFDRMTEDKLRQWVEANPGRVNDRDNRGIAPLFAAVAFLSVSLSWCDYWTRKGP